MKYIFATLITTSIMYTGYKATEKACDWVDKLFDYSERKRNDR